MRHNLEDYSSTDLQRALVSPYQSFETKDKIEIELIKRQHEEKEKYDE